MIPPELAALRPEDLRVEAEFFEVLDEPTPGAASPGSVPVPRRRSRGRLCRLLRRHSAPPEPAYVARFAPAPVAATPGPIAAPPPLPVPPVDVVVPPIQLETSSILPPVTESRRIREVTLPAIRRTRLVGLRPRLRRDVVHRRAADRALPLENRPLSRGFGSRQEPFTE